jgi:hypothetical protein
MRASPGAFRYYSHNFPGLYNSLRRGNPNLRPIGTPNSQEDERFVTSEDPRNTIFHNYRLVNMAVADIPRQAILNDTSFGIRHSRRRAAELGGAGFRKFERLKRAGGGDYYAFEGARDLTAPRIDTMMRLLNQGFGDWLAFPGARDLTASRIDTMIRLCVEEGILPVFAFRAARDLTDSQLESMIRLKRTGVNENVSSMASKDFTDIQIDNLLILLADNPGMSGASAYWAIRGDR